MEIKARDALTGKDEAQLINYLKAVEVEVGVLINFGAYPDLQWKRMVCSRKRSANYANQR